MEASRSSEAQLKWQSESYPSFMSTQLPLLPTYTIVMAGTNSTHPLHCCKNGMKGLIQDPHLTDDKTEVPSVE